MTTRNDNFAERLRRVVEKAGGVNEIARICGVTTQSVYGWLAGSKPYRDRVTRISIALGINESWLWKGEGPEMLDNEPTARTRDEPHLPSAHAFSGLDDEEIAQRLSELVLSFHQVPPAFVPEAITSINSTFAEFRRRAETRTARAVTHRGNRKP